MACNIFFGKNIVLQEKSFNFGGRKEKRLTPDEKHVEWPEAITKKTIQYKLVQTKKFNKK